MHGTLFSRFYQNLKNSTTLSFGIFHRLPILNTSIRLVWSNSGMVTYLFLSLFRIPIKKHGNQTFFRPTPCFHVFSHISSCHNSLSFLQCIPLHTCRGYTDRSLRIDKNNFYQVRKHLQGPDIKSSCIFLCYSHEKRFFQKRYC